MLEVFVVFVGVVHHAWGDEGDDFFAIDGVVSAGEEFSKDGDVTQKGNFAGQSCFFFFQQARQDDGLAILHHDVGGRLSTVNGGSAVVDGGANLRQFQTDVHIDIFLGGDPGTGIEDQANGTVFKALGAARSACVGNDLIRKGEFGSVEEECFLVVCGEDNRVLHHSNIGHLCQRLQHCVGAELGREGARVKQTEDIELLGGRVGGVHAQSEGVVAIFNRKASGTHTQAKIQFVVQFDFCDHHRKFNLTARAVKEGDEIPKGLFLGAGGQHGEGVLAGDWHDSCFTDEGGLGGVLLVASAAALPREGHGLGILSRLIGTGSSVGQLVD